LKGFSKISENDIDNNKAHVSHTTEYEEMKTEPQLYITYPEINHKL